MGHHRLPTGTKAESNALDRVQNKATYLVKDLQGLSSEERRSSLGLFPLAYRRLRGDLEVYKLLNNITQMDVIEFWNVRPSRNGPLLVKNQTGPTQAGHGR